ncbi:MAG: 50S ribosomal protein L18 [Phycisphaerales bacterium]|jgi:large subunit ribosomal protein L18
MPSATYLKNVRRARRRKGLQKRIRGTPERPRLSVFRSLKHIYAQVICDVTGRTLAEASDRAGKGGDVKAKTDSAKRVGSALAERAKKAGVTQVVFDRNGYLYHGRVKALAEGAREGGLQF